MGRAGCVSHIPSSLLLQLSISPVVLFPSMIFSTLARLTSVFRAEGRYAVRRPSSIQRKKVLRDMENISSNLRESIKLASGTRAIEFMRVLYDFARKKAFNRCHAVKFSSKWAWCLAFFCSEHARAFCFRRFSAAFFLSGSGPATASWRMQTVAASICSSWV